MQSNPKETPVSFFFSSMQWDLKIFHLMKIFHACYNEKKLKNQLL